MATPIRVVQGDITRMRTDAIVNAANPSLLGGGGVDEAIHRAAGPALVDACRAIAQVHPYVRCPTGEARITPGFDLPASHVIHTVGPIWHGGALGEAALLAACYHHVLRLARRHALWHVIFPAISCGVYGYPADQAAAIAVAAIGSELRGDTAAWQVDLCCYSASMCQTVQHALDKALEA